jgi:hypothetical protein
MLRGGKRPGAGRPKGSKNKNTVAIQAAKTGELPLDYMLRVMRDKAADKDRRDEMAKAAAPYLHAKRASEDARGRVPNRFIDVSKLNDAELAELKRLRDLVDRHGVVGSDTAEGGDRGRADATRH